METVRLKLEVAMRIFSLVVYRGMLFAAAADMVSCISAGEFLTAKVGGRQSGWRGSLGKRGQTTGREVCRLNKEADESKRK